jgi:hypothetical protein
MRPRQIERVVADDTMRQRDISYRLVHEASATEQMEPGMVL